MTMIEGYACVFNTLNSHQDTVVPGAFKETLVTPGRTPVRLLWDHSDGTPIGIIRDLYEDEKGLRFMAEIMPDLPMAKEVILMLGMGIVSGASMGFKLKRYIQDNDESTRTLLDINLLEISLVTVPAQPEAWVKIMETKDV